jgi:hypothetical protein
MFNWGLKKGFLTENPVARIEFASVKRDEMEIWRVDDVQKLLEDCLADDLELLPYRVLTIFCGTRPRDEMSRLTCNDSNFRRES